MTRMETYRPTKAIIDLGAIRRNTARILEKYPGYRYYMAVVKADSYGFRGEKVIRAMLDGGANCFAASLLEEGLALRDHTALLSYSTDAYVSAEDIFVTMRPLVFLFVLHFTYLLMRKILQRLKKFIQLQKF